MGECFLGEQLGVRQVAQQVVQADRHRGKFGVRVAAKQLVLLRAVEAVADKGECVPDVAELLVAAGEGDGQAQRLGPVVSGDGLHVQRVELADSLIELTGRFECFGAQPTRASTQRGGDLLVSEELVHPGERVGALTIAQRHLGVLELQVEPGGRLGVDPAEQHLGGTAKLLGQRVDGSGAGDALVRFEEGHVARGDSVGGQVGLGKVGGAPNAAQSLPERLLMRARESLVAPFVRISCCDRHLLGCHVIRHAAA